MDFCRVFLVIFILYDGYLMNLELLFGRVIFFLYILYEKCIIKFIWVIFFFFLMILLFLGVCK